MLISIFAHIRQRNKPEGVETLWTGDGPGQDLAARQGCYKTHSVRKPLRVSYRKPSYRKPAA